MSSGAQRQPKFGVWQVGGVPNVVEFSLVVLDEILAAVTDAHGSFSRGGLEVGGVLFGSRQEGGIRVEAWRPISCEHASGPRFVLSENDERRLSESLEESSHEPSLRGMVPVGWYRSQTRGQGTLSGQDSEVFNRYFPAHWQVAMVFHPEEGAPHLVSVFVRHADGTLRTEPSLLDLAEGAPEANGEEAIDERPQPEIEPFFVPEAEPELRPVRGIWKWALFGVLVAALAGASILHWGQPFQPAEWAPPGFVSLRLSEADGLLRIVWNAAAEPVLRAERATMEISDGGQKMTIPLEAVQLRAGWLPYMRRSGDIRVRLAIEQPGGEPVTEVVRFVGRPPVQEEDSEAIRARDQLREEAARIGALLETRKGEADRLQATVAGLEAKAKAAPAERAPPPEKPAETRPPPPRPAAPRATATDVKPPNAAPASGRLIWTGLLDRNAVLTIEERRPWSGQITGGLPGVPVRIEVYPAELSSKGLTVFSANSQHSSDAVTEPPGPRNGWNQTSYRWDTERARDITIVEAPSEQNGWRRLAVRAGERPLTALVVDWTAR